MDRRSFFVGMLASPLTMLPRRAKEEPVTTTISVSVDSGEIQRIVEVATAEALKGYDRAAPDRLRAMVERRG